MPVATNVYDDGERFNAVAKVGKHRKEKRFPRSTPLRTITAWLEKTRGEFRKRQRQRQRSSGTLTDDVTSYLADLPKGRHRADVAVALRAWLPTLGSSKRVLLTTAKLQAIVNGWLDEGYAATTLAHRRRALAQLIEALDGPEDNPARRLKVPRPAAPQARRVEMTVLQAILDGMDARRSSRLRRGPAFRNRAQACLYMTLGTGITPISLRRLRPHAIDLDAARIELPPRLKGRGAAAVTVPLFPLGVVACRKWLRAHAVGGISQRAVGRAFHTAVRTYVAREAAAGRTVLLPPDLRPYDLRHSFLSWLWEETRDILLVQEYAQHADLETTRRYVRGAVSARMQAAADQIRAKLADRVVGSGSRKHA